MVYTHRSALSVFVVHGCPPVSPNCFTVRLLFVHARVQGGDIGEVAVTAIVV
ncbi:MAG: hypothetical protein UY09_C0030G0022 [Parcubacteria group bacterium GW2011_GWA2_47_8]|nr:MAG: hypothetical protein UY09_C0030G0022 [Parcubacteria group bacterium GW2011_GWA2_47_8]